MLIVSYCPAGFSVRAGQIFHPASRIVGREASLAFRASMMSCRRRQSSAHLSSASPTRVRAVRMSSFSWRLARDVFRIPAFLDHLLAAALGKWREFFPLLWRQLVPHDL